MREGEDPRDIHWRKSAAVGQMVMRERARETRPDVTLPLDTVRPAPSGDDWSAAFERRIRDVASRAVAHIKRGDRVTVTTSAGGVARSDRSRRCRSASALSRARSSRRGSPTQRSEQRGRRVRFGLVHRVMTDALAALGVLAVVSTASLSPWTNALLVMGLAAALAIPEGWQGRPPLRHFATIAPLALLFVQGGRLLAGRIPARRRRRVRGACSRSSASPPDAAPRTTSRSSSSRSFTSSPAPCSAAGSTYGLCFLGFLVVAPGALVLSHLRREVEGNYRQGARDRTGLPVDVPRILRSRRVVGRGFLAGDVPALASHLPLHGSALRRSFRGSVSRSSSSIIRTRVA